VKYYRNVKRAQEEMKEKLNFRADKSWVPGHKSFFKQRKKKE
jgi:hypothetical protein